MAEALTLEAAKQTAKLLEATAAAAAKRRRAAGVGEDATAVENLAAASRADATALVAAAKGAAKALPRQDDADAADALALWRESFFSFKSPRPPQHHARAAGRKTKRAT